VDCGRLGEERIDHREDRETGVMERGQRDGVLERPPRVLGEVDRTQNRLYANRSSVSQPSEQVPFGIRGGSGAERPPPRPAYW